MALIEITPPAGIVKNGTDYANKGRFVDGDLVRFENGYLKPLGGWTLFRQNPVGTFFSATVTTTVSPNEAYLLLLPPRTLKQRTSLAPELSATFNLVSC